MCNQTTNIYVLIPADLSHTGYARWKHTKIDSCISDIVKAFQFAGINMRASCCGHEKTNGRIDLQDGRILEITKKIEES